MARSKSWTESQQPENQYSYGQYVFNVAMVGIVIAGLVALLFWLLSPAPTPVTRLITVHSSPRGELRVIPFQANDIEKLLSAFPESSVDCEAFDDQQSFESAVHAKVKGVAFDEIDTMLVICSAIGGVSNDSKPILRPTNGNGEISIEKFLEECFANSQAANRILVLDCNHDFSIPESYLERGFSQGGDFNTFSDQVGSLLRGFKTPDGRPVWVITATSVGEVPLYSVNRRRTLFSLAIENALTDNYEHVGEFYDSVVAYCRKHGGEAAQTPLLFESNQGQIESSAVTHSDVSGRMVKLANNNSSGLEPKSGDDVDPIQDPKTENELQKITEFWDLRDQIVRDKYSSENLLLPSQFATNEWDHAVLEIAEQSVAMRDSNLSGVSISLVQNFSDSEKIREAESVNRLYPGFIRADPPVVLSGSEKDEEDIARAFARYQSTVFRAKYYSAVYDSLSWIDGSDPLNRFRARLILLNKSLLENKSLFEDRNASKNETQQYLDAAREFKRLDEDIELRLQSVCRRIESMHGMTREMAVVGLLDSPLIRLGSIQAPAASDRLGLLNMLRTEIAGSGELLSRDTRKTNSRDRYVVYQQLGNILAPPAGLDNRKLDSLAYYLRLPASFLPAPILFGERTVIRTADAGNKYPGGQIVDRYSGDPAQPGGSRIDIKLKTNPENGRVNLICKLDPEAPFVVFDPDNPINNVGKQIEIKNSSGIIGIYAEVDAEAAAGVNKTFSLTVQIAQSFQGNEFSNPQKPFSIPLLLPSQNRVDLYVNLGRRQIDERVGPDATLALRPWPNLATPISMSVSNNWHRARKLQVTVYPCLAVDRNQNRPIMPGEIDDAIKQRTLLSLANGRLPRIVTSKVLEIGPSVDGKHSEPVAIEWQAAGATADPSQPAPRAHDPGKPFPQGLLCQVKDVSDESSPSWNYWLPVFPETRNYVSLRPRVENNQLLVNFEKLPEFEDRPVKIRWRLPETRFRESGGITLNSLIKNDVVVIDDLRATIPENRYPFLYVDVDNWPRRVALVYDGLTFTEPHTDTNTRFPNASFSGYKLTKSEEVPETPPFRVIDIQSDNFIAKILGHRPVGNRPDVLYGTLEINCVINATQFNFPDSNDYLEISYDNESRKYYFPRRVQSYLDADLETGVWKLRCDVSDYSEELEITGSPFDIDPVKFVFQGRVQELDGNDITRFIFDSIPPYKPVLTVHTKKVAPGGNVGFEVSTIQDNSGGVGTTGDSSMEYILNKMPPEKPQGRLLNKGWLVFKAPKEEGTYGLRVRVRDRLGNSVTTDEVSFEVKMPPKPSAGDKKTDPPPIPVTHTLLVKVKIASNPLQKGQDPELVIEPPDGTPKRISGDTFEISGLKGGVEYEISGKYKMESGFKVETQGKTSWKFSKDAPTKITKTKILTLEGK